MNHYVIDTARRVDVSIILSRKIIAISGCKILSLQGRESVISFYVQADRGFATSRLYSD